MNISKEVYKYLKTKAEADKAKALLSLELLGNNAVGIGDHSNVTEAIQSEIDKIAGWDHRIEVIKKYVK